MDINLQHRYRKHGFKLLHFVALFFVMAIICIPGLWIVLNSFRPSVEIMAKPPIWNPTFTLDHYRAMFGGVGEGGVPVLKYFKNSLIISVTSTLIAILIGMSGGYAFARYRFKGKNGYFVGLMLFRAVPGVALSLPLFIVFARIG
ncbi:MAG: carbohydrate ABC transporter permease, partial [Rhizobiales bacterium]|nr:carbohydrate ABC transporter permease [Hyphomicrobiales bacterium]